MKTRNPIPYKTKSILQKEIGSVCPFCENKDVEHFEIHHIDENPENNELSNLIMLCPTCHSKITKGDITKDEVIKTKLKISSAIDVEVDKDVKPLLDQLKELLDKTNLTKQKNYMRKQRKLQIEKMMITAEQKSKDSMQEF